jgi:hypothetical protein
MRPVVRIRFLTRLFLLAVAACVVGVIVGGCPPGQGGSAANHAVRVATFNTECIVPEMGDLNILTQVVNAVEKAGTLCNGTLADIAGDILSAGGLTDDRGVIKDAVRERAKAIVNLINARKNDFDIIALNEVFLEDARQIFVDGLGGTFPYHVDKLEGGTPCTEDSGLMLFSRWPFEELGQNPGSPGGPPVVPFYNAWQQFDDCRCEDCLADKGVGYVRVQNPNTGDEYDVAFAHLQADSQVCLPGTSAAPPPYSVIRDSQLQQVSELIQSWVGTAKQWAGGTNVIFMGDLNTVGTQERAAMAASLPTPDNDEWHEKFDPAQATGFFAGRLSAPNAARPLYDAWAQTTSPWDPGVTHGTEDRLDYIFLNAVPASGAQPPYQRRLVPHHMTLLPFNDESDHHGVLAVLNRWQPYCMPVEARAPQAGYSLPGGPGPAPNQLSLGPWPNNQVYDMEISVPGGYQWFRFDLPGSYSLSLVNGNNWLQQNEASGFDLRVYTATDLTDDISNYYGETTQLNQYFPNPNGITVVNPNTIIARKYLVPDGPFYVRISPQDPAGTGRYRLYVHRHEGKTKEDAVLLPVCCTQEYFQGTAALNAEDMPWFQINLERPDNPASHQHLRFVVLWDEAGLEGPWTLRLQDEADTVLAQSSDAKVSSPSVNNNDPAYGEKTPRHYVEVIHDNLEDLSTAPNPRFYLRVSRPGLIINGALTSPYDRYRLRWETNLTVLHGKSWAGTQSMRLVANDETCIDAGNSDEIGIQMWADGQLVYDLDDNDIGGNATDMDTGDSVSLEQIVHPVRYVKNFQFRVLEFDPGGADYGELRTLGPLKPQQDKAWKASSKVNVPCSGVGSDGEYELFYNRSRTMQYPPCD